MKNLKTAFCVMVILLMFQTIANAQMGKKINQVNFQEILDQQFKADQPGVTLLVAKEGEILFKGAAGLANLELNIPMHADHILRIGSITKQFTAVAILMLQEQGKLNLEDDLTKFIPTYPTLGKKITVEHLLTHTSGIRSYTSIPGFMNDIRNDLTTSEMMDKFKDKQMLFDPGEEFNYNNSGYFLLGMIIEKVSGISYGDFIEINIFEKIGMKNSYYGNSKKVIPNRASGYEMENGEIINAPYLSMTIPYAAGSLISTVEDLYKWNQALHQYKLIRKESLEKAHTSFILNNGEATNYGYGWGVNQFYGSPTIQHDGGINGFMTSATYLPEEDIFVAAFSNGKEPAMLTKLILGQIVGKISEGEEKKFVQRNPRIV